MSVFWRPTTKKETRRTFGNVRVLVRKKEKNENIPESQKREKPIERVRTVKETKFDVLTFDVFARDFTKTKTYAKRNEYFRR